MLAHITKMAGYTPGLTTTDGVYIDGQRTVEGDMTGPVSARMVLAASADRLRGAGDRARRPAARRHGRAPCQRRRGAQRAVRPPGHEGHRHAGAAGRGQAHRGRGGARTARCSTPTTPTWCACPAYTDAQAPSATSPLNPHTRPGARAHPRRRPRLRAGGRRQRPDDHALRQGRPHPAAVDAPDPGHAGRPRDAQRAERDVRRGHGLLAWASSSTPSARACAPSTPPSSRRRAA